ncbi:hypothetical protein PVAND_014048 [Polypedilum vanderplanki]|uniref:Uncharacterized protein n=1 Tax=Polypedilum vanderplanki TaxID=319348 RepID=A0A9J6CS25_POLVA|nr:hypothetical protein PVAND_014048 [Polypedilum vanderplanki]
MKFSIFFTILLSLQTFDLFESFTINCTFRTTSLDVIGSVYQCYTSSIPRTSGEIITNVTGTHLSGMSNINVTGVYIEGNRTLQFFPRNFSNFFPNLKAIDIYRTTIETLFGNEFDEFPLFEYIWWNTSPLSTISSRLFEKTPKMVQIDFHGNQLQRVGYDLFTPFNVTQLRRLCFHTNPCITSDIATSQANIINVINILRQNCTYHDPITTSTTQLPITSTTQSPITTTTQPSTTTTTQKPLTCSNATIENLVCDLKDSMTEVQDDLLTKDDEINKLKTDLAEVKNQLDQTNNKLDNTQNEVIILQSTLKWVKSELEWLHNHHCMCDDNKIF